MQSLFNPEANRKIIERINKLTSESKPVWGKMNAAQMLAHSQAPLQVAFGELKLKRGLIGFLFGGIAKKKMMAPGPFTKNLPTAPKFLVNDDRNFEEEKTKLIDLIKKFGEGPGGLSQQPHPFFGKLANEEWDVLQWKHLDHHLTQFGV